MKHRTEAGVSLIVVLMVLMVMLFTSVGILRSSNTTLGIVGNLSFKQNAVSVADGGVETARTWLITRPLGVLNAHDPVSGYFASWLPVNWDPLTFDWDASSVLSAANDGTGNQVRYVIHRMCAIVGPTDDPLQQCVAPISAGSNGSRQLGGQGAVYNPLLSAVYRVTVRVDGPRNTVAYSQVNVF